VEEKIVKGIFLTFEGPEGSGKSTQAKLISSSLLADGYDVCLTAEPGGTGLGQKIRDILLEKEEIKVGALAELFLFEADRAQHLEEIILPALAENKIVICDRFNTATFAYQGYGLEMDRSVIEEIDKTACGDLKPDLTIVLDIAPEMGMARATSGGRADRMEKRDAAFHSRVRKGYLEMAGRSSGRIKVINGFPGVEEVHEDIKREVYAFIEKHKRAD
jgi:dTMP kinase